MQLWFHNHPNCQSTSKTLSYWNSRIDSRQPQYHPTSDWQRSGLIIPGISDVFTYYSAAVTKVRLAVLSRHSLHC